MESLSHSFPQQFFVHFLLSRSFTSTTSLPFHALSPPSHTLKNFSKWKSRSKNQAVKSLFAHVSKKQTLALERRTGGDGDTDGLYVREHGMRPSLFTTPLEEETRQDETRERTAFIRELEN